MSQTILYSLIASGVNGRINLNIQGTVFLEAIDVFFIEIEINFIANRKKNDALWN